VLQTEMSAEKLRPKSQVS